jgi:hypothetical protein
MHAVVVIVILVVIALILAGAAAVISWRSPRHRPSPELDSPPSPFAGRGKQAAGFTIESRSGPRSAQPGSGFTVLSRSGPRPAQPANNTGGRKTTTAGPDGFNTAEVIQNPNAICKLIGKPVAECGCPLHHGNQRKGKR